MITVDSLAKSKRHLADDQLSAVSGPYDHLCQRRWVGDDAELIRASMKSSTMFDGESRTREGDRSPE